MKKLLMLLFCLFFVSNSYATELRKNFVCDEVSGDCADIISTNGFNGLVALAPGHVSTDNSTTSNLGIDGVFEGEWEDITNFGVIVISLTSDQSSNTDGLVVQFSSDGTIGGIISDDEYTYTANAKKTFSFQAAAQYFRVVYTNNDTVEQSSFNLQTILKPYYVKPSSHRIQDSIIDDDDAEDVNSAWLHRKIVNQFYHQHTGNITTLNTAASEGDISISVADTSGFIVGDELKIEENGSEEIGIPIITVVAAGTPGTLTLDRPIGLDF